MNTNRALFIRDKAILIADKDEPCLKQIGAFLQDDGFKNLLFARSGKELHEKLKPFQQKPQDIGLIIVSENLPDCRAHELCVSIGEGDHEIGVPFILLSEIAMQEGITKSVAQHENFIHRLAKPVIREELLPVVNCALLLKKERDLRCEHEVRLIGELAKRKVMESRLKHLVSHDELTGLANRRNLEQNLNLVIQRSKSFDNEGSLLYIDIDRFNIINDLEGYDAGDRLLVEVVDLIRGILKGDEYLARIGSDEFCVYLESNIRKDVLQVAERLRKCLEDHRFVAGAVCYRVSVSIGIAFFEAAAKISHPTQLIAQAHQACYVAKNNGRNMIWIYNHKDLALQKRQQDIHWVPLIREALAERKIFLVFQPVVRVSDGLITHYEALLRLNGKDNQVFLPGEFIPIAERTGMMQRLDLWVVENAIDFLASLPEHQAHIALTVNLSGMAFQDRALLPLIKQKLEMTWLDPARVTFEITETTVVENWQQAQEMIEKIRALGCHFSLDDFGSGFSSFHYIKNFPVDYLKIDGQFIRNMLDNETDRVLVKAMIEIGRKLGKRTIAEYVENPEVLKLLKEMGVDYVQGYLTGRPSADLSATNSVNIVELIENAKELTVESFYG
jgi:diguanylate cyclase (GGDEF)-like protein